MPAFAEPLSITPLYQVPLWPDISTKGAFAPTDASRSRTRIGVFRQPVSSAACSVTIGGRPAASASRIAPPSASFTLHTTVVGKPSFVPAPGFPQTGETHISWMCS
jgi:hypothetical protein